MAVILRSDPLSRIHPEPQTLEIDHFDYLPDSILLLVFNKIGDVKALGRCCVVSKRFHSLVPQVENVVVRVDCVISDDESSSLSLPISPDLSPPVPSPPSSVSFSAASLSRYRLWDSSSARSGRLSPIRRFFEKVRDGIYLAYSDLHAYLAGDSACTKEAISGLHKTISSILIGYLNGRKQVYATESVHILMDFSAFSRQRDFAGVHNSQGLICFSD